MSIYRSSAITASKKSRPAALEDNFTHNMVLDMITSGKIPKMDHEGPSFSLDFVPIDYLISTLLNLSTSDLVRSDCKAATYYHIGNPSPLKLSALPGLLPKIRDDGLAGEMLPVGDWAQVMYERAVDEKKQIEWAVFKEYLDLGHNMFSLDNTRTNEALKKSGDQRPKVDCAPVDEMFLREMLKC